MTAGDPIPGRREVTRVRTDGSPEQFAAALRHFLQAARDEEDPPTNPCQGRCEFHGKLWCLTYNRTCQEYVDLYPKDRVPAAEGGHSFINQFLDNERKQQMSISVNKYTKIQVCLSGHEFELTPPEAQELHDFLESVLTDDRPRVTRVRKARASKMLKRGSPEWNARADKQIFAAIDANPGLSRQQLMNSCTGDWEDVVARIKLHVAEGRITTTRTPSRSGPAGTHRINHYRLPPIAPNLLPPPRRPSFLT